jgi:hypothetical protein
MAKRFKDLVDKMTPERRAAIHERAAAMLRELDSAPAVEGAEKQDRSAKPRSEAEH